MVDHGSFFVSKSKNSAIYWFSTVDAMFAVLVLSSSISIKNYCSITSTTLHLLQHCCDVVSTIEEFPASVDLITYEKHALAVAYCS